MLSACLVPLACAGGEGTTDGTGGASSGGVQATGGTGTVSTGGVVATGGVATAATGGSVQTGGSPAATGGSPPVTTGGTSSNTGGTSSGGIIGAGGVSSTGGSTTTTGGVSSTGGSTTMGGSSGKGGTSSGGSSIGGGGATGGGTSTGGKSNTGGASTGGTSTGGASSGGKSNTGGASTGGTSTGGNSALCPAGITQTITVAKDGSGQFSTVQAAVNSIASGSSARIRIDIKAGTYSEKLTIASRTNLCLVGAGATNTILTYNDSNGSVGSTSGSASVLISANDFSAANLTIQNSYGSGSQAVALRTTGQRQQFLNCRFVGYQDTLYTHQGMQYFRNCYVQGNTDYVFGGATAVLQNCEVRNVENGSAVAAPNTDAGTAYGIVFLGGKFTAASGVKANSVGLGRPWGAQGFGAYLNVELGSHIIGAGFVEMSGNQPQNARFHEYQSTGSGANAGSRSSYQLTASQAASYTLGTILGGWTPSYSQ